MNSCFVLKMLFTLTSLTKGSRANSGFYPIRDPCTTAIGFIDHALGCSWRIRGLGYNYLWHDLEELDSSELGSGLSESGSGFWHNYFYEDGDGWDFTDIEEKMCMDAVDRFETCMHELDTCDNAELVANLDGYISSYASQFCSGRKISDRLQRLNLAVDNDDAVAFFNGVTCVNVEEFDVIFADGECYFNLSMYESIWTNSFKDVASVLESGFRSSFSCALDNVTYSDCDDIYLVEPMVFYVYIILLIPGIDVPFNEVYAPYDTSPVNPNAPERSTVAIFGDPHLYVFGTNMDSGEFITCSSPGNTKYLSNDYIEIYGVNTNVDEDDPKSASYMTSASITIKNKDGNIAAMYEAGNSELPSNFTTHSGESKEAEIELTDNGFLMIRIKEAGVVISLANYAHTYQLVLRMADRLFLKSTGLLYTGCSGDDLINHDARGDRRKRSPVCEGLDVAVQGACEFDYTTTGNATLALGATSVLTAMTQEVEAQDSVFIEKDGAGPINATLPLVIIMVAYVKLVCM